MKKLHRLGALTLVAASLAGLVAMAAVDEDQDGLDDRVEDGVAERFAPIVEPELRDWVDGQRIPLISPETVAAAALAAARSGETGEAWVVQPGREPVVYGFRGVPGPR